MPLYLTEYARERIIHVNDHTLARFLDMFHHRVTCFFYRAWAVNQQAVSFEQLEYDRIAEYVASLIGDGMESFHKRDAVPDRAKLHYSCPASRSFLNHGFAFVRIRPGVICGRPGIS